MSIIFTLILLLLSYTSSVLSSKDDEFALLKVKKQLGNPSELSSWVEGTDYCHWAKVSCNSVRAFATDPGDGRVRSLYLSSLNISASFPHAICKLTELEGFNLTNIPGLYGPIPSCFNKLSKLYFVYISETNISGPMPSFPYQPDLVHITLLRNRFSGSIPPSLAALPNLLHLDLSSNYLTGTVPPGLFRNSSSTLFLRNNNLTGELPKCYGWVNFNRLDMAQNRLSGDASFLFGKQKSAFIINLSSNEFEFDLSYVEFPESLAILDLSHNKIFGRVPESLKNNFGLYILNLSNNKLCGELPQGGFMWQYYADAFANNACLCGKPLPPCFNLAPAPSTP